jgi:hypothetical protein
MLVEHNMFICDIIACLYTILLSIKVFWLNQVFSFVNIVEFVVHVLFKKPINFDMAIFFYYHYFVYCDIPSIFELL